MDGILSGRTPCIMVVVDVGMVKVVFVTMLEDLFVDFYQK